MERRLHKLPGKHSLEHGGQEPPYCLRSFKRHKVSASPQFPKSIGAIVGEFYGTSNAGVTTVEPEFENVKAGLSPIELESVSLKPPVLQCKASSMNVEKGLLGVLEKPELHNAGNYSFIRKHFDILPSSDTSMPCVLPRKYPPPKIRKGVTIFREFPPDCGRRNLDMFSKFDVLPERKSSKGKQCQAEMEQIGGGSSDVSSESASVAEGKTLEDINDKVKAESEKGAHADKAELFEKVNHCEWKFNQEAGSDAITNTSFPVSNSSQANSSSKMACATEGYDEKRFELLGHKGSYFLLLKHNDIKFNDGGTASRKGVKASDCASATYASGGCSDKVYELMGHKGSYYLLLKHDDTIFSAAEENQGGVKASDCTEATVASDGCSDSIHELMGHEGSYYLLVKDNDANFHVPFVEADVCNVEADVHNVEADWKHNSNLSGKPSISLTADSNQEALCRSKVREVLNLFQKTLKARLLKNQVTIKAQGKNQTISSDVYEEVAMILKQQMKWINMNKQVLGAVPGVEVGDQFQYRAELVIVGVHAQFVASIDYMEKDGKKIATSIVSTHCYSDVEKLSDVIFFCEGGIQTITDQKLNDQTLVRGNLALKNSMDEETPVRVIRGFQSLEGKSTTYTYDGLFTVIKFSQERAQNGEWVYMFQLNRMQGQPKLKVNKLGRYGKSKALYYRTLIDDISYGNEKIPIPVVNDIDNSKPPAFSYITKMVYPKLKKSANPRGCRCSDGCSDLVRCSCVVRNDGRVPFNENGALIKAKETFVYECGPSCKCPPSCMNRVSQHGLKIQLEVFKTETRGWGIRSRNFISSGSFICEYVGELLDDKQAEERIGFDEYLFDIGDEDGFAIDAAKIGNIGRFVNHSCSPNLYAQDVLFDHDDKMMPHVMLFATTKIYPLQELTYNYNYKIGKVSDSNGNVKMKKCYCGSRKCKGRLY
ncbi:histone-lysine N-methyltransferase, H3 lysine-9 specific SUVH5-like [Apium graveolens]|uniref:histone-lysine N-methyltransferase, H3 lysine-9 specific SUVH5-like n=1 Tax=Apium graveolens TaxID=4045 RepID=UPI003D7986D4